MTGIIFFATEDLETMVTFYRTTFGATVWLEQPDCTILQLDNQLLGFCDRDQTDTDGVVTIVTEDQDGVDDLYARLSIEGDDPPAVNERYEIYHFYTTDPDGRSVEVQTFLHDTAPITW